MPNVGTASLDLLVDKQQLGKSITDGVDSVSKTASEKMRSVGKTMSKAITLPVLAGFAFATKAASDLSESVNKTDVVFGKSSKSIHDFSKSAAKDLGQSQRAAEEATGTFGNLFVSMKIGQQPAADMSKKLVTLASDLASFNNVSPEDALEALRSGLVGETEPLRKFGVNLNDASIRAEAMKLGLIATTKDALTPAAKAQASYSLILQQTTTAQGDFARTSGGLANQSRILKAELEDTAASMGTKLIPVALKLAEAGNGVLSAFSGLDPVLQDVALGGVALVAGLGPVLTVAGNVSKAIDGLKKAYSGLGLVGSVGVAGLAVGIGLAIKAFADAKRQADELGDAIRKGIKPNDIDSLNVALKRANSAWDEAAGNVRGYQGALGGTRAFIGNIVQTLSPLENKVQDNSAAFKEATGAQEELARATIHYKENVATLGNTLGLTEKETLNLANRTGADLTDAFSDVVPKLTDAYRATQNATVSSEGLATAQETLGDKTQTVTDRLDAFKTALDASLGVQLDAEEAQSRHQEAIDRLTASLAENGNTFDLNTEKGRANAEARRNVIATAGAEVDAMARASTVTGVEAGQKQALIDKLNGLKATFPTLSGPIDGYIAKLGQIPDSKTTDVTVKLHNTAALDALIAKLNSNTLAARDFEVPNTRLPDKKRAAGGPIWGGDWVVGEWGRGAEHMHLNPGSSGYVTNAQQTAAGAVDIHAAVRAVSPGGSGGDLVIKVGEETLARITSAALRRWEIDGGPVPWSS